MLDTDSSLITYVVTVPVTSAAEPARYPTITMNVTTTSSERALIVAMDEVTDRGYTLDTDRAASVTLD